MGRDALSTRIKAIDKKLAETPINAEERSIFKVHEQLLKVNAKAYKPVLLAIGPYNDHRKVGQGLMEEHKLRYLKQMLRRRNERSVEVYIRTLRDLEERARNCYAERISLKKGEFVEMMLLDGCFIIELFRKWEMSSPRDEHDPIFQLDWMLPKIARDLLLFENQLPFFVLTKLFLMIERSQTLHPNRSGHLGEHIVDIEQKYEISRLESSTSIHQSVQIRRLGDLAISFFSGSIHIQDWEVNGSSSYSTEKIKHLLCRTHTAITPPLAKMVHEHLKVGDKFKKADFKHLLDLIHTIIRLSILDMELHHATESQEVGVKFKKGEIFKHLFGPIHGVVSALLAKMEKMMKSFKKMNELQKYRFKFNMPEKFKRLHGQKRIEDWKTIPYGTELHEARVEFKMAEKFRDKFNESISWDSIPDAIAFQEAEVELEKAEKFRDLLAGRNRNQDGKSKLSRAKFKMVERFMRLPCLNKFENWNSIPQGTELKEAKVEFKKAKKFRDTINMMKSTPNATELKEGGVKFKKAKQRTTFAKFSNGVLEISPLRIEDETETFFRNLIAHEQYSPYINDSCYVTDYVCFIDDLIDSPKDVELLRRKGIVENWLGDDEVVSTMVNKLGHHVGISTNSIYVKTSIDMNKHCAKRLNVWMAKLRHIHFNSPWALLSVLAAFLLLGLAITQTVFSIIH
ncbi:hypothetical protein I3843_01G118200 [Carya illinoinensis]|uniref:Uncharacterized protein n=1 Tax=Carya illinoinensis TaxID=32201 RepID=A0A922A2R9_CARIL|nr:hypothetical protein I3842_Q095200 [Carya illinoinensis]KAG7995599.1 hypothetical protein I3843_01G118200 [Carya illinoinensis]